MRWNNNIRASLAIFQAFLLCLILVSGSLFMHKHTTASGKIVIHMHPYDLSSDSSNPLHHESEEEIHFLDVVFQGQFLQTCFVNLPTPVTNAINSDYGIHRNDPFLQACHALAAPRGPPPIFS